MKRFQELDKTMRIREWFHSLIVPEDMWIIIRVDGRSFSRLTESFEKPFSDTFHSLMVQTSLDLYKEFSCIYGETHSDEISMLLPLHTDMFSREVEKLVSVSAGIASSSFTGTAVRSNILTLNHPISFDSRIWMSANLKEVFDYFAWRQLDAARGAIHSWAYWSLRATGLSAGATTKILKHKNFAQQNEVLHNLGLNFNDVTMWQRRGTAFFTEEIVKTGHDPRTGEEKLVTRSAQHFDENLPMKEEYHAYITSKIWDKI